MPVLTKPLIRAEVRAKVGDDDSNNYLMPDDTMDRNIDSILKSMVKYAWNDGEESIAGDGTNMEYSITNPIKQTISQVVYRSGTDVSTEQPVYYYQIFNGKIRLPFVPSSGYNIVIRWRKPYALSDTIPDFAAEILYKLLQIEWIAYATMKRADFEQWAATNRSDTRIGELIQLKREIERDLDEMAKDMSSRLSITDVWGGI